MRVRFGVLGRSWTVRLLGAALAAGIAAGCGEHRGDEPGAPDDPVPAWSSSTEQSSTDTDPGSPGRARQEQG